LTAYRFDFTRCEFNTPVKRPHELGSGE